MDFSEKHTIVCYIDKNKALFYKDVDGSILQMDFMPDTISDQEVTGREKLEYLIKSFLETNKLEKGNIIFIYAPDIAIEKDFPDEMAGNKNDEIQKFIEMIPFEEVLSKIYKLDKNTKVVAINQALYESIKNIFTQRNFLVLGVIPSTVLQATVAELSMNIDLAFIANRIDSLRQYSIVNESEPNNQNAKEKSSLKERNVRMYVLVTVLAILLFILIILVIAKFFPRNSPKNLPVVQPPISPTPTVPLINQPSIPILQPSVGTPSGSNINFNNEQKTM